MEPIFTDAGKLCPGCNIRKPLSEFCKNKSEKSGVCSYCKPCHRANRLKMVEKYQNRPPAMEATCYLCKQVKPAKAFAKDRTRPTGLHAECRECATAVGLHQGERKKQTNAMWLKANPEARKRNSLRSHLRRKFNIKLEDFEAMAQAQEHKCAICGEPHEDKRLSVDHDHDTGKVRALLCICCNSGLGHFRDSPDILMRAIQYLKRHKNE